jgi:hypothetical protein
MAIPGGGPGGGAWTAGQGLSQNGEAFQIEFLPAPELPTTPPEVNGIFTRRDDNSLFVGTGAITFAIAAGPGEAPESSSSYDGPEVEVVVTSQTQVYRDATFNAGPPSEGGEIQQKVEPGDIEEIGSDSALTVWGKKSGDRVIAEVLMYSSPTIMVAPTR